MQVGDGLDSTPLMAGYPVPDRSQARGPSLGAGLPSGAKATLLLATRQSGLRLFLKEHIPKENPQDYAVVWSLRVPAPKALVECLVLAST